MLKKIHNLQDKFLSKNFQGGKNSMAAKSNCQSSDSTIRLLRSKSSSLQLFHPPFIVDYPDRLYNIIYTRVAVTITKQGSNKEAWENLVACIACFEMTLISDLTRGETRETVMFLPLENPAKSPCVCKSRRISQHK